MIGYVPTGLRVPPCGSWPRPLSYKMGLLYQKKKWDLFIKGHQFSARHCMGTFEIDSKTIDSNSFINGVSPVHRVMRLSIRIGIINDYSPRKIEMQKDRTVKWWSFLHDWMDFCTTAIIKKINGPDFWNYVLEKGLEEDLLPMPNFTERRDKDRAVTLGGQRPGPCRTVLWNSASATNLLPTLFQERSSKNRFR